MPAWNYVETGPAQAGAPGGLAPEGRGEQDYVEFLPDGGVPGTGPFRVDYLGNITVNGVAALKGGTDTSADAAASSPSFVSGTALQVNATQDTMLYIVVATSTSVKVDIGPTSGVATGLVPTGSYIAPDVIGGIRVPKGWFVKITATIANLTITAITC